MSDRKGKATPLSLHTQPRPFFFLCEKKRAKTKKKKKQQKIKSVKETALNVLLNVFAILANQLYRMIAYRKYACEISIRPQVYFDETRTEIKSKDIPHTFI